MTDTERIANEVYDRLIPRPSSVEMLERYAGTRHESEAAALVLMRSADHIYLKQDNGNPDNYKAVDLMDGLRESLNDCPRLQYVKAHGGPHESGLSIPGNG